MDDLTIKIGVKADSKDARLLLDKLLDTIKTPFAWFAQKIEPILDAKADCKALQLRADQASSLGQALGMPAEDAALLLLRGEQRELFLRIRQQMNIEAIVNGAVLEAHGPISDQPVDPDWTTDFFEQCKNVGDKELQSLWSRILAGEVAEPGSFSRRTLAIVRTLSRQEANNFTKFCSLLWKELENQAMYFIFADWNQVFLSGLETSDITELEAVGLIHLAIDSTLTIRGKDHLMYFDELYSIEPAPGSQNEMTYKMKALTQPGVSLVPIAGAKKKEDYRRQTIEMFEKTGRIVRRC